VPRDVATLKDCVCKSETPNMPTEPKIKGPASYFPSIEKTYGKPIAHWLAILEAAGQRKHMEYVALLKSEHQLGHGHANALVAYFLAQK
jgi:Domain of unknown function (DUF4287)